jgi:hypothetical protein
MSVRRRDGESPRIAPARRKLAVMGRGVSQLIARLADELGERATLRVETLGGGAECVELVPRNLAAATVTVEHDPNGDDEDEELWITVADEAAEPGDLEWLETALRAVIAGRVRVLEGSGRYRVEIEVSEDDLRHSTTHDLFRGLLPAPGWRWRAKVTQFEPY